MITASKLLKLCIKMMLIGEEPNQNDWELMTLQEQHSLIYGWYVDFYY